MLKLLLNRKPKRLDPKSSHYASLKQQNVILIVIFQNCNNRKFYKRELQRERKRKGEREGKREIAALKQQKKKDRENKKERDKKKRRESEMQSWKMFSIA